MNILRAYKRTRFFLVINILGLAIGLAVSIMLILFVVNELSYDKHFINYERIIRLNTVTDSGGNKRVYGINLRKAYTELPEKVPGIEAVVQIYIGGEAELIYNDAHFDYLPLMFVDPDFFKVFQLKFIEGTPQTALKDLNSVVITRKQADIIFGSPADAIGKNVKVSEQEGVVTAVVEELPLNTHFYFDILVNMKASGIENAQGLEFFTYYLIDENASLEEVSHSIVKEYQPMVDIWSGSFSREAYGATEKLGDIYLHSEATSLGKTNSMSFVWLLIVLALVILLLAIANFINLFIAQGETRMPEIGIRKANGASIQNVVRQFFSEVSFIVMIAFAAGFALTILFTPYFSELINKEIDLIQLINPWFIVSIILLFVITIVLSASYPSFYLSRFSPLDILNRRIRFSKRRLTVVIVVIQSVITIVLISYIWMINRQASYLENMPLGYNPKNVVSFLLNGNLMKSYEALKQELLSLPEVEAVGGSNHTIGRGCSGQGISLLENRERNFGINEYRVLPGLCEVMQFQLKEGGFFKENTPDSIRQIILNETAVRMMGLKPPVAGQYVHYKGNAEIIGVVKDFYYKEPADEIEPLLLSSRLWGGISLYIKFKENINRAHGQNAVNTVLNKFDSGFVANPTWSEDIYQSKFESLKMQSKIVMIASFLSMFIAMLGLVAVHLYATTRRIKEIGIRRINGAASMNIFVLLSSDIVKWVLIAGVFAVPLAYYLAVEWMSNYTNRASLDWSIFVIPILVQCFIALLVTSGVSIRTISRNPVESLKAE